jgi:hypothetical protein
MRRQEPRDSPNSTRELGPIDATIRACGLASLRTTTQCRENERTHGDRCDGDDACGADFTGDEAPGLATNEPSGGDAMFGATAFDTLTGITLSRTTGSASVTVRGDSLSALATTVRSTTVSVFPAADCAAGFDRTRWTS